MGEQMDTSIFQYKSWLLHACFLPVLSESPIPLARRLPLGGPIVVTHVNNAEGETLYAYPIYLVGIWHTCTYVWVCVCVHECRLYYVFFVFWETYALLTKYFNLTAFCMQCGRLGSTRFGSNVWAIGSVQSGSVAAWLEGL